MMEKTDACECHSNTILVASIDNIVITNRTSCLSNVLHSALVSSLDVVTKWEESIRT